MLLQVQNPKTKRLSDFKRAAGGALAAAAAAAGLLTTPMAHGAGAERQAGSVVALLQVAPGQLKRARLMRVEEPQQPMEPSPAAAPLGRAEASLARGAAMALLGAACLWLAARQRSLKTLKQGPLEVRAG